MAPLGYALGDPLAQVSAPAFTFLIFLAVSVAPVAHPLAEAIP
jgi:hypothetical protein